MAALTCRVSTNPDQPGEPPRREPPSPPTLLGTVFDTVRVFGRDLLSLATGRPADASSPPAADATEAPDAPADVEAKRVGVLTKIAEQLRGAADGYLAAKLDEIEARVDQKLDGIEARIDRKIVDLNRQLADLRDQELRHRLRLLKITLIFTVLVAALSLLYKWISRYFQTP